MKNIEFLFEHFSTHIKKVLGELFVFSLLDLRLTLFHTEDLHDRTILRNILIEAGLSTTELECIVDVLDQAQLLQTKYREAIATISYPLPPSVFEYTSSFVSAGN